ncbi:MAG TPA: hydantoinase/oxoprolinase family protein [Geminicoccaceae bacterium]
MGAETIVGVDVGGTFTDLVLIEPASRRARVAKVPTTADNQAGGVLHALEAAGIELAGVRALIHGTTTTTNALLERKLAPVGLITTAGFRDVLELGRRTRPRPYGLLGSFEPLIPRQRRLEVSERIDASGEVLEPLDEAAVRDAAQRLLALGSETLLIHFLHAYANPVHERRAAEIAREIWPNEHITIGSAVLSEYREYERGVTAAVEAAVGPVLARYLERLERDLEARGFAHDLLVMQGNGGSAAASEVTRKAVTTVMSGPASGVMAAAALARATRRSSLITYDMGGTSTDVGLILDGLPAVTAELELDYAMPIHVPMVDVHTIGAGGGSIARLDEAGLLRVGPESAGAVPGPICYGRGGTEPTITDANLLLGRLDPKGLLALEGGADVDLVRRRIDERIGRPLGLAPDDAAVAILRVASDRMAGAIRMVSLARGHDPRDFTLMAYGGAGPLHASALARELGIPRVLVPARPGITNAIGCATADLRQDFVNTVNRPLPSLDPELVRDLLAAQLEAGRTWLTRQGVATGEVEVRRFADMQFEGQTHILTVALPDPAPSVRTLHELFARAYHDRFEVELEEIRPVLVNLHSAIIGHRPPVPLDALAEPADGTGPELGARPVRFGERWMTTPVLARRALAPGTALEGPAVIQQLDATTLLEPGDRLEVDRLGNLLIEIGR